MSSFNAGPWHDGKYPQSEISPFNQESLPQRAKLGALFLGSIGALFAPSCGSNSDQAEAAIIEKRVEEQVSKKFAEYVAEREGTIIDRAAEALTLRHEYSYELGKTFTGMIDEWQATREEMKRDMLDPIVRVSIEEGYGLGSGVIVYSRLNPATSSYESYILTNWHVVVESHGHFRQDILEILDASSSDSVLVEVFESSGEIKCMPAQVVAHDALQDLALLKVESSEILPFVKVADEAEGAALRPFDLVFAVGCQAGAEPFPTLGMMSATGVENSHSALGVERNMSSSPIYPGSSGGGLFLGYNHKLIGIISEVTAQGSMFGVDLVSHMGLSIPAGTLQRFLFSSGLEIREDGSLEMRVTESEPLPLAADTRLEPSDQPQPDERR